MVERSRRGVWTVTPWATALAASLALGACGDDDDDVDVGERVTFEVRIENVSTTDTLQTSAGPMAIPLSPGAYAVHGPDVEIFTIGEPASAGLEAIAEDGTPAFLAPTLDRTAGVFDAGAFEVPVGTSTAAPIGPGEAYEFTVEAERGDYLSFATMFVQSNDLFFAPAPEGIPLFDDAEPISGDVTDEVLLWDAGTEVNQEPGVGPDQAPRQAGTDTGADENGVVVSIDAVTDGYTYPAVDQVIRVTITPLD